MLLSEVPAVSAPQMRDGALVFRCSAASIGVPVEERILATEVFQRSRIRSYSLAQRVRLVLEVALRLALLRGS